MAPIDPPSGKSYLSGCPDVDFTIPSGQAVAGMAVGILVLDLGYPLLPGNVANAVTYPFPVRFKILRGTSIPQIMRHDPALLDAIIQSGRELIQDGVRAIVGACGYFGYYQAAAAAELEVPIFLSSLLQIPLIRHALKADQKVGVICANRQALSPKMLASCNVHDLDDIVIAGAEDLSEFANILKCTCHFNPQKMQEELVRLSLDFVGEHPEIGALLLECSDMPPFAWAIQNAVGLPVFDYITMIRWIHTSLIQRPYQGFM